MPLMKPVEIDRGTSPLILAVPHSGSFVPDDIADGFNEVGRALTDADWHVDQLYDGLVDDATMVRATFHRYVIDANRDPSGASLYPGQNTTGLCPVTDFHGNSIYLNDREPGAEDIECRRINYHAPYHLALAQEIERVHAINGVAILYDCHSILSTIPYLFDGVLPDFNIGTFNGQSCDQKVENTVANICAHAEGYTSVVNGRFKGGWTTRHYGAPEKGVHSIQMELAQSTYMREDTSHELIEERAKKLRTVLREILTALSDVATALRG